MTILSALTSYLCCLLVTSNISQEILPELLEVVPLDVRRKMWFQHVGVPTHFTNVREYLDKTFGNRWIEGGGPTTWPPRSPDLTLSDFFLWGYMQGLVYETPVETQHDLVATIAVAAATIREMPGTPQRVQHNITRQCKIGKEVGGRYFEQLLKCQTKITFPKTYAFSRKTL
jgi:hypothetical protein